MTLSAGDWVCFEAGSGKKHYLENVTDEDSEFVFFRKANVVSDVVY